MGKRGGQAEQASGVGTEADGRSRITGMDPIWISFWICIAVAVTLPLYSASKKRKDKGNLIGSAKLNL